MANNKQLKSFGKKLWFLSATLAFIVFISIIFSFSSEQTEQDKEYHSRFLQNYSVYSINTPINIDFCGEAVPANDADVRERLDKELLSNIYFQSNTLLLIKRANKWFPIITPILKKHGIPGDFKYLPLVESNLSNTVSPAGATGYWQLMKNTAISYGLEISDQIDERYHVEKSTEAACKYLLNSYSIFNNWTLCAAAYNMGIEGIRQQLEKQKSNNYYDLYLNTETSRYMFRILAIKEIVSQPEKYGYQLRSKDLYSQALTHVLNIDTGISNLAEFAINQNINYKILKILNPWLIANSLPVKENGYYQIIIPDSGYSVYGTYLNDSLIMPQIENVNPPLADTAKLLND